MGDVDPTFIASVSTILFMLGPVNSGLSVYTNQMQYNMSLLKGRKIICIKPTNGLKYPKCVEKQAKLFTVTVKSQPHSTAYNEVEAGTKN